MNVLPEIMRNLCVPGGGKYCNVSGISGSRNHCQCIAVRRVEKGCCRRIILFVDCQVMWKGISEE